MPDVVDKATRSRMMAGIRGKNTKPERVVRSHFHRAGLRFRLQAKLPGRPDLVLPKYSTVVFVHGCFWHRHNACKFTTTPVSNATFWQEKFESNIRRDVVVRQKLKRLGWKVHVIWGCELTPSKLDAVVAEIKGVLGA